MCALAVRLCLADGSHESELCVFSFARSASERASEQRTRATSMRALENDLTFARCNELTREAASEASEKQKETEAQR